MELLFDYVPDPVDLRKVALRRTFADTMWQRYLAIVVAGLAIWCLVSAAAFVVVTEFDVASAAEAYVGICFSVAHYVVLAILAPHMFLLWMASKAPCDYKDAAEGLELQVRLDDEGILRSRAGVAIRWDWSQCDVRVLDGTVEIFVGGRLDFIIRRGRLSEEAYQHILKAIKQPGTEAITDAVSDEQVEPRE